MATLPHKQAVRALTVGLVSAGVLAGAMLVGPAGTASASALANIPVFEDPAPVPPTDPILDAQVPPNQGPANQSPPVHRRRPLDDPGIHR